MAFFTFDAPPAAPAAGADSAAGASIGRQLRSFLRSRRGRSALAFGLYLLFTLIVIGRGVLLHPSTRVVGDNGADKTIFIWALDWWPWAVAHGHDPFNAFTIWAPHGIDLAWVTGVPGASILALPVTLLANPIAAYNVLVLLALPTAAWTAFLLARRITRQWPASVVAGYIFGFSPYMLGHSVGHLNLILVFTIPLAALLVLKRYDGESSGVRCVATLTPVLVAQFLFSTEIFLTMTLVGVLFAVLGALFAHQPQRLLATVIPVIVAYAVSAVVLTPYLIHLATSNTQGPPRHPELGETDVLNYVIATRRIWLRIPGSEHVRLQFTSNGAEQGAYIAPPLLAILALYALRRRWPPRRTIPILATVAIVLASFGPFLRVAGTKEARGPWSLVWHLPFLRNVLPNRFPMYVALLVGLICALWLAESARSAWRWALVLAGIAMMLPNPTGRIWSAETLQSTFITSGDYRNYTRPGDVVLLTPYGPAGWSMVWQAESNFRYRMVGGHVGYHIIPAEEQWANVYRSFTGHRRHSAGPGMLRRFLLAHHVRLVIQGPRTPPKIQRLIAAAVHSPPTAVDDALLYQVK